MQENPFNKFIEFMREEGKFFNEPSFYFGKVKNGTPNITVIANGVPLDTRDLLIDDMILSKGLNTNDLVILVPYGKKLVIISKVVNI